ncbi:GNAT family N-acetyltransferase [Rodentibacter myodis]|uniref:GNAT family N-acetyltransferase n=1 Tax=Rodentibacter myodis TaxID=1907939 RepID=A0A1V3JTZ0_9PAST|nr:GNAT family N-acetyltransferase [Rodentibacter myodis]OOF60189.1 GNAT family N-acetyltransferase [Rodentibacter myodis]
MKIQHKEFHQQGEFFILDEQGKKIAELTYFYETDSKINANHTFVSDQLRGQGVADKLYQALISFIQEKQLTLHPTCSYIERKWQRDNQK